MRYWRGGYIRVPAPILRTSSPFQLRDLTSGQRIADHPMEFSSAVFYSMVRNWGWGAPDYLWPRAAEALLGAGVPVVVVAPAALRTRSEIQLLEAKGADFYEQAPVQYGGGRANQLKRSLDHLRPAVRRLQRRLNQLENPYVFFNQSGSYDLLDEWAVRPLLESRPIAYDVFFHSNNYATPLTEHRRQTAAALFSEARRCLFNSDWTRSLTEVQILARLANAEVFPPVVRFDYPQPLAWPETPKVLLASVSRFDTHHKGLDVLLQGLAQLGPDLPEWQLDLYGRGPEREYLEKLAVWLGISGRVRFHDFVEDVRTIWRQCHVLVLTSRYEGLSVAMLEAMACGRPVLRTPYGGCAEWVVHGETGFVCPAAEPALIAASVSECLKRRSELRQMGLRAHARVLERLPSDPESVYLSPFGMVNPATTTSQFNAAGR